MTDQKSWEKQLEEQFGTWLYPNADVIETFIENLLAAQKKQLLREIDRHFEVRTDGTAGCTWGDTDYDSKSVAYGMNEAYEEVQTVLRKIAERYKIDLES